MNKILIAAAVMALAGEVPAASPDSTNRSDLLVESAERSVGARVANALVDRKLYDYKKGYIHYAVVSYWVNALEFSRITGDKPLEDKLVKAFYAIAPERWSDWHHVDLAVQGALWLEIAILTGDEKAKARGLEYADTQWAAPYEGEPMSPFKSVGNQPLAVREKWHREGCSSQTRLWIDDMYMITLLQTQAYRATGQRVYLERAAKEMVKYLEVLPRGDGLFNHSDTAPFAWGRGNGWMAAAMTLLLDYRDALPSAERAVIERHHAAMMAALRRWQRPNGLWGQLVDDPESWDETSASAMFGYALGDIRAFRALAALVDDRGLLPGVCVGTGATNDRDFYLKRPRALGDPHGQAPFLWLVNRLLRFGFDSTNRSDLLVESL